MKKSPKYIATNVPGWFRDPRTGATLNINNDALRLYREQVAQAKERQEHEEEMKQMTDKINKLELLINKLIKD
jgi:hypothetical protein